MFKIPDGQEVTDFGFTVYDAESGRRADIETTSYVIDNMGTLYDGYSAYDGLADMKIPKEGKYVVRFADGRYMRY